MAGAWVSGALRSRASCIRHPRQAPSELQRGRWGLDGDHQHGALRVIQNPCGGRAQVRVPSHHDEVCIVASRRPKNGACRVGFVHDSCVVHVHAGSYDVAESLQSISHDPVANSSRKWVLHSADTNAVYVVHEGDSPAKLGRERGCRLQHGEPRRAQVGCHEPRGAAPLLTCQEDRARGFSDDPMTDVMRRWRGLGWATRTRVPTDDEEAGAQLPRRRRERRGRLPKAYPDQATGQPDAELGPCPSLRLQLRGHRPSTSLVQARHLSTRGETMRQGQYVHRDEIHAQEARQLQPSGEGQCRGRTERQAHDDTSPKGCGSA